MAKKKHIPPPMTELEFVRDHLTYINRTAGVIEYIRDGDNYEDGFHEDPLEGIRAAIKSIRATRADIAGATPQEIDAIFAGDL